MSTVLMDRLTPSTLADFHGIEVSRQLIAPGNRNRRRRRVALATSPPKLNAQRIQRKHADATANEDGTDLER